MPEEAVTGARNLWADHWRTAGVTIQDRDVYYYLDTVKLDYARRLLGPAGTCLEVGAGSARLSALLAGEGHDLTCLDYTEEGLEAARRNFAAAGVDGTFVRGDARALPFPSDSFDAVFSTGLLEHFPDASPILAEMVRVTRGGGIVFSDIVPRKFSALRAFDFLRPEPAQFERPFSRDQIRDLLAGAGLESIGVFPAGIFPPLWAPFLIRSARYRRAHGSIVRLSLPLLRRLDGTWLAEKLGFYWFCWGTKPAAGDRG